MTSGQDELASRLSRLEDISAITATKWRYLRACDRKRADLARACLTDDAVLDYEGFPVFDSPEMFVEIFTRYGCVPHIIDMHHGIHPIVDVRGDEAEATFDLFFFQIDTKARRQTQLAVSYEDVFVRHQTGWLIRRSVSRRISMMVSELDKDGYGKIVVAGRSDSDEPSPPPRI